MATRDREETPREGKGGSPRPAREFANPSIHGPWIDALCVGGLSIIVIVGFLVLVTMEPGWVARFRPEVPEVSAAEEINKDARQPSSLHVADGSGIDNMLLMLWLTVLLNNPHFMSSYRLLYRSREQILQYRWSSMYMPLLLVVAAFFIMVGQMGYLAPEGTLGWLPAVILQVLGALASLYLAWHYNGQAWGMTASFLYLRGIRVTQYERRCIRSAYWALTAFHVLWALSLFMRGHGQLAQLRDVVAVLSLLMIPLGIHGFLRVQRRTGKRIPLPALLPWVAIYFWYGLIYFHDYALIFLQLSHSLQYLCFTSRVELNLARKRWESANPPRLGVTWSLVLIYLALLGSGWFVFELARFVPMTTPQEQMLQKGLGLLAVIVNIHHYFVDGAIWKISNPKVRRDLFAHLQPVT